MPDKNPKLLYSIAEVVEITGICRNRIQQEIDSGRLKKFSLFGYSPVKVSHAALTDWINNNESFTNQNFPQVFNRS